MAAGVKSFRIDDVTMEKFKEISAEISSKNQQQTFEKLFECYELQKKKKKFWQIWR